ncbi:MAG TPA: fatty acid--CoA ligase family protein [Steroidobacteraceae bacterium]|nr:fatty acid--CoA ligase family protein [Steroidobacteraceae bacterium]
MMASLWDSAARAGNRPRAALHAPAASLALADLAHGSCLGGRLEALRGRSVLLAMREQLSSAIALIELDGVARRLVLCTPELSAEALREVAAAAGTDTELTDLDPKPVSAPIERRASEATEWILLTSGTTGTPKLVAHSFATLAGTLPRQAPGSAAVWSTFYDIRRYGGLQIYLRALLAGVPLVLSSPQESTAQFLARAGAGGVTHISGTPSHWRRALMSGALALLQPEYVRLSGEVADQVLLDQLRAAYPGARIAHAFASTEAGVAFDVDDGLAGFPAELLDRPRNGIEMRVEDGTLRIRSGRIAAGYLGSGARALGDAQGYVDTGDLVELEKGRYYFRGRKGGVINVGGLKVYPEEVEGVLNADPRVRMSRVRPKRNPIMGALVVAEVVLEDGAGSGLGAADEQTLRKELLESCRRALPAHKVPARLTFVPALELTAAGKLVRPDA